MPSAGSMVTVIETGVTLLVCDGQNNYYDGHEKVGCHEKRYGPMMWAL